MAITTGCASKAPLPTPSQVDLDRFMGAWFVVGYTPILVDGKAHNAVEHYFLAPDGKIRTTYQYRDGGFDAKLKTHTPVGTVYNAETNAEWRMQFIWPFKAQYIIYYLSDDYNRTIIAHPNRKYAWIMQRTPTISDGDYEDMLKKLEAVGFERSLIQRLPHDWSSDQERLRVIESIGSRKPLADAGL
ncbi:lipocalin family protein [Puniceicoccales bacterium CK1056]|uniref:Lipocalin family protein n=1 Tax=Oceanipulchritudo coccoides TaxID=2706888 RepID=A0A6B2LZD5_9BACT|nr:lipocalin family protein [Oceanipulchritudo coccoides]NDV61803.1 lipocalin family protein [Oceanipulchritudo coccoides]